MIVLTFAPMHVIGPGRYDEIWFNFLVNYERRSAMWRDGTRLRCRELHTFLCTFQNLKVIIKQVIIAPLCEQWYFKFSGENIHILWQSVFKLDALLNKSKDYLLSSLNCKLFTFNSPFQILVLTWEYGNEQMHQFTPSKAPKTSTMAFLLPCSNK